MDALTPRKTLLKPLSDEEFQQTVSLECDNAVDWIDSNISNIRRLAEDYYQGKTSIPAEKGRSNIIVTTVRDTIHQVLPSIGRIFCQTDTTGEFSSDDEEDEQICKEMTLFVNGVFNKYEGYSCLITATTNALKSRVGIVKVDLEKKLVGSHQRTQNLSEDELKELMFEVQMGDVIITELSDPQMDPMSGVDMGRQAVLTRKSYRNKWLLTTIAPEELLVDSEATSVEDARLIGIRRELPIWQAMRLLDLSFDDLSKMTTDDGSSLKNERNSRLGYDPTSFSENGVNDQTTKHVLITEAWMRVDADGDGIVELRHLICGGPTYEILVDEVVQFVPLAIFKIDLQPNVFFPISLAEDLIQDQDALTIITRSILDNVALVNQPRTAINENMVNLEDAKNTEIGAIIRTKATGQIEELVTPFTAGNTLPVLEYLHQNSEARSGVTKLSQGLDPNALQSTSRIAANAAVMGSDSRLEMMARNIAETGMKNLFLTILRTAMYQLTSKQSIKTPQGYKQVNPAFWHDQINININVGLGNGRIEEKQQTLMGVAAVQQEIIKLLGPANPLSGWENLRNTYKLLLRLSGIKNVSDFFPFVDPQVINQLDQQQKQMAAQASQNPPPPDLVGAAKVKAQSDMQINQAKIAAQTQGDIQKMQAEQQMKFADMQKETQKTIAEMQQKHQLEMTSLRSEMITKMTIAGWQVDQKRDEANQKFATDAAKAQLDAQTKVDVARENATNQVGPQQ
jgi:hypothetical protein